MTPEQKQRLVQARDREEAEKRALDATAVYSKVQFIKDCLQKAGITPENARRFLDRFLRARSEDPMSEEEAASALAEMGVDVDVELKKLLEAFGEQGDQMTGFYDQHFGDAIATDEQERTLRSSEAEARRFLSDYDKEGAQVISKILPRDVAYVCAALLYRSKQVDPLFEQRILNTSGIHCTLQSVEGRKCVALAWRLLDPMEARAVAATLLKLADEASA